MKIILLVFVSFLFLGCATTLPYEKINYTSDDIPNFHKVSDELYRSAQPTGKGFTMLEAMGFKSIISFRDFHSDSFKLIGLKLEYLRIPESAWHPEIEDVNRFLEAVRIMPKPVLAHCMSGKDRTGAMIAAYRIKVQGWSKEAAIAEMLDPRFGDHGTWGPGLARFITAMP